MTSNKTVVFYSYKDFLKRKDKSINGVSEYMAKKYPDYRKDNSTNKGCWDCRKCRNCTDCTDCWYARNSYKCFKCSYSSNLKYCSEVHSSHDCVKVKDIEDVSFIDNLEP